MLKWTTKLAAGMTLRTSDAWSRSFVL